jgi:uncharacterized protein involved in exopolysaccharide biosynthesis
MTLLQFFRIFAGQLKLMLLIGTILAAVVFNGTRNEQLEYSSHTLINTGLVSGYNIESSSGAKVDYAYTNNEIENLISVATSYETTEELAMRLLARYIIMDEPNPDFITLEGWEEMKKEDVHEVRKLVKAKGDMEGTLAKIRQYRSDRQENPVQKLLYSKHPFFGIERLESIQVMREGKSDQLRFKYSTIDPAVCRFTLQELTTIFIEKHRHIKEMQSTDVLEFFENATKEAQANLSGKEDGLLAFMVGNKIINYYEQTRFIAAKKEDLDEMYFKELMNLSGADSTLKRLEREMGKQVSLPELNSRLVMKREELSNLTARIAEYELFNFDTIATDIPGLEQMKKRAKEIQAEIRSTADATFAVNRTPEGIELKNLLTQWLNEVVEIEKAFARLSVLKERKAEFEIIYSKFAPWGSQLKRMEREIDVAERAYLENLHSYNQARLHQYSMMMSANLKVIDPPFLPVKPAGSKRMMLVVVAFMAGFILTLGVAVALEMLDSTLKNPVRAAEQTGLEVVGAFPKFPARKSKKEKIDFDDIQERSMGQLLQQIKLHLRSVNVPEGQPNRVALFSTRAGEGKTFLTHLALEKLRATGERVAYLYPGLPSAWLHPDDFSYQVGIHFFEMDSEKALVNSMDFDEKNYSYIFLEMPPLLKDSYPVDLLAKYNLALLFARANRTWNHADTKALNIFSTGVSTKPKLVVNALRVEALEDSLGEIPKRRSKIRRFIKRAILFDFSKKM